VNVKRIVAYSFVLHHTVVAVVKLWCYHSSRF
jgi:hypothetical protein